MTDDIKSICIPKDGKFVTRVKPVQLPERETLLAYFVDGEKEIRFGFVERWQINTAYADNAMLASISYTVRCINGKRYQLLGIPHNVSAAIQPCLDEAGFLVDNDLQEVAGF